MALAALVLGILAVVFFFLFFPIGFILAVLAIVFGFIGRSRASRDPRLGRGGMALAGIILGVITVVLVIIVGIIIGVIVNEADEGLDDLDQQEIEEQIEDLNLEGQ
jgi:predicted PurR-regulated permease PerM